MRKGTSFITGLLLGAAAGAIAGILYAPAKGAETRKKLNHDLHDLGEKAKSTVNKRVSKVQEEISGLVDNLKHRASKAEEEVKEAASKAKDAVREKVEPKRGAKKS